MGTSYGVRRLYRVLQPSNKLRIQIKVQMKNLPDFFLGNVLLVVSAFVTGFAMDVLKGTNGLQVIGFIVGSVLLLFGVFLVVDSCIKS